VHIRAAAAAGGGAHALAVQAETTACGELSGHPDDILADDPACAIDDSGHWAYLTDTLNGMRSKVRHLPMLFDDYREQLSGDEDCFVRPHSPLNTVSALRATNRQWWSAVRC
jgi:hypothetical protein